MNNHPAQVCFYDDLPNPNWAQVGAADAFVSGEKRIAKWLPKSTLVLLDAHIKRHATPAPLSAADVVVPDRFDRGIDGLLSRNPVSLTLVQDEHVKGALQVSLIHALDPAQFPRTSGDMTCAYRDDGPAIRRSMICGWVAGDHATYLLKTALKLGGRLMQRPDLGVCINQVMAFSNFRTLESKIQEDPRLREQLADYDAAHAPKVSSEADKRDLLLYQRYDHGRLRVIESLARKVLGTLIDAEKERAECERTKGKDAAIALSKTLPFDPAISTHLRIGGDVLEDTIRAGAFPNNMIGFGPRVLVRYAPDPT